MSDNSVESVGGMRCKTTVEDDGRVYTDMWHYGENKNILTSLRVNGLAFCQQKEIIEAIYKVLDFLEKGV